MFPTLIVDVLVNADPVAPAAELDSRVQGWNQAKSKQNANSQNASHNDDQVRYETDIAPPIHSWRQATMVTSNRERLIRGQTYKSPKFDSQKLQ